MPCAPHSFCVYTISDDLRLMSSPTLDEIFKMKDVKLVIDWVQVDARPDATNKENGDPFYVFHAFADRGVRIARNSGIWVWESSMSLFDQAKLHEATKDSKLDIQFGINKNPLCMTHCFGTDAQKLLPVKRCDQSDFRPRKKQATNKAKVASQKTNMQVTSIASDKCKEARIAMLADSARAALVAAVAASPTNAVPFGFKKQPPPLAKLPTSPPAKPELTSPPAKPESTSPPAKPEPTSPRFRLFIESLAPSDSDSDDYAESDSDDVDDAASNSDDVEDAASD